MPYSFHAPLYGVWKVVTVMHNCMNLYLSWAVLLGHQIQYSSKYLPVVFCSSHVLAVGIKYTTVQSHTVIFYVTVKYWSPLKWDFHSFAQSRLDFVITMVWYVVDCQTNSNIGNLEQQEIPLFSPFSDIVYLISCCYFVIKLDEHIGIPDMKLHETWLQYGVRG